MDVYDKAAEFLVGTKNAVGFTGAGSSAESGIPTFRDPGGIWDQFDPAEFGTVEGIMEVFERKPDMIREFLLSSINTFGAASPNGGHVALAELEEMGVVTAVITQNIDNLHEDAGSKRVIDVHGNLFRARCLSCGRKQALDKEEFLQKARAALETPDGFGLNSLIGLMPPCGCGGLTRPDVVMFGEAVQRLNDAFRTAAGCEVMVVMGTSGVVYPAAALPHQAHEAGAKIIEVNPTENCYARVTELHIDEPAGEAMPKVMERLRKLLAH